MTSKQKAGKKTGPRPERLKIKGGWETAVGKTFKKERAEGRVAPETQQSR
jgi:hypothetical protein